MVDGALLMRFSSLSYGDQDTLAQQIGTTPAKVFSSMASLNVAAMLF